MKTDRAPLQWKEIDGWLTDAEGEMLGMLAIGADVLELGSYKGRSTVCLAQFAKSVTAVDHHKGDSGAGFEDTRADFTANILASGLGDRITPVNLDIDKIGGDSGFNRSQQFDLVFVDDDHHQAERSTRVAMKYLKPGGTIAWHDFNMTVVRAGIAACGLFPVNMVGSLAWLKLP